MDKITKVLLDGTMSLRSFIYGIGSVLNLFPSPLRPLSKPVMTDEQAIRSDWEQVGQDLKEAMDNVEGQESTARRS